MLKVTDNPVSRYPLERLLIDDAGLWAVAHVKSRQEKSLARDLARWGISYYMPMVEKRTRRNDNGKVRKSLIPLFPGYLAFALEPERWEKIYSTRRVANLLAVSEQDLFVEELTQIQCALGMGVAVELAPAFEPGQAVRVTAGPMQGLGGEVVRNRGAAEFIIRVQMFQQAVKVEIDEMYLEAR